MMKRILEQQEIIESLIPLKTDIKEEDSPPTPPPPATKVEDPEPPLRQTVTPAKPPVASLLNRSFLRQSTIHSQGTTPTRLSAPSKITSYFT
jgi:hypothetical protein